MATSGKVDYPWYAAVSGEDLEQGDILLNCPVFEIPPVAVQGNVTDVPVNVYERNLIVLSQTCDLQLRQDGTCKLDDVILCRFYFKKELCSDPRFGKPQEWENARKGRFPAYHVLNKCELEGLSLDFMLVDFRRVYSLPVAVVRQIAASRCPRIRLLPPYQEHLSQAFARFFMRVGLPVDVPPFTK